MSNESYTSKGGKVFVDKSSVTVDDSHVLEIVSNEVDYPHVRQSRNGGEIVLATRENLEALMKFSGIRVQHDVIKKSVIVSGVYARSGDEENAVIAQLKSLCGLYGLSRQIVDEQLNAIMGINAVNPVTRWLKNIKRSRSGDPIKDLMEALPIENKQWAYIAFKRWFIQCVAAADAGESSGNKDALPKYESILTFYGSQGTRKSSFMRSLLPTELKCYMEDGYLLDVARNDSIFQALQNWIVELGELDSTFRKSDISAIKAFMSKQEDTLRLPYAKAPITMPRQTSFLGSVNEAQFLRDTTGNRRYLPIVVIGKLIVPDSFDAADFWAYVWELYLMGDQWWLTDDEEELQKASLSVHQHLGLEDELRDMFDFSKSSRTNQLRGAQIIDMMNMTQSHAKSTVLGNTLKAMGVSRDKVGRAYAMPPSFTV